MAGNYEKIIKENLITLYRNLPDDLTERVGAERRGDVYTFQAFGDICRIEPDAIYLGEEIQEGPLGIIVSLYLLHATKEPLILEPFRAFKEFPDSMPYTGAFITHTESILAPHVQQIFDSRTAILACLKDGESPSKIAGDFSFVVSPLPKIKLCYIFYHADDDFPASVTCLYSHNANHFIPIDGLADIGEYTSKKIISCIA